VFLSIFRNVFRRDVDSLTSERRQKSDVDVDEQKSRQKQEASSRQHRQTRRSQGNLVAAGKKNNYLFQVTGIRQTDATSFG
jgi:hypothetical protein